VCYKIPMKRYLLTAAGRDRAGLVAAVSKILFDNGCNLEDSAMTRLQGEFAVLVIFSGPARATGVERALRALGKKLGLAVQLKPLTARESRAPKNADNAVLITVYGADRPGIVHRVTHLLSRAKVNITDLTTHRTAAPGRPSGYILYIEGEAPDGLAPAALESPLRAGVAQLGVTVGVKPLASQAL